MLLQAISPLVGGVGEDPFGRSWQRLQQIIGWLDAQEAAGLEHGQLECRLQSEGRELVRCLLQDHLDLRSVRERRLEAVADGEGTEHRAVARDHQRPLYSVFGEVSVNRLAYRARGQENLYVADGLLNLPGEHASHGVRRLAGIESAASSFERATGRVRERTGLTLGKRQAQELAVRSALDFDAFYAERVSAAEAHGRGEEDVLVLSADGKGIVMRSEALRQATAKAAQRASPKLATRLSGGEVGPQADRRGRRRLRDRARAAHGRRRARSHRREGTGGAEGQAQVADRLRSLRHRHGDRGHLR